MAPGQALPVYVIHHRAPGWCRSTVESLSSSTIPVEVHVVDNGGLGPLPDATVLTQPRNLGFAGAANVALGHWLSDTSSELGVITSHDLDLPANALEQLAAFAADHPTVGVLGPALTGTGRGPLEDYAVAFGRNAASPGVQPGLPGASSCSWISGSCLVLRRRCVEAVGPFDERMGSYCEDVDYGVRANTLGWRVVVVDEVRGRTRGTSGTGADRLIFSNWILVGAKHLGAVATAGRVVRVGRRVVRMLLRALARPGEVGRSVGLAVDAAVGLCRGAVLAVRWYRHRVWRRVIGMAPVEASCTDAALRRRLAEIGLPRAVVEL